MAARKAFLHWGQSNCEGKGDLTELVGLTGSRWDHEGVYSNIYFWQNRLWDFASDEGRFTQLSLDPSLYDGIPLSDYDYFPHLSQPSFVGQLVAEVFGPELEIAMGLSGYYQEATYHIKLGAPSTYISRKEPEAETSGIPGDWFWQSAHQSWHPSLPKSVSPAYTTTEATTFTSLAVSTTTVTVSGTPWGVNAYRGYWVICGDSQALIASNTSDTLTLVQGFLGASGATGWMGDNVPAAALACQIVLREPRGPYVATTVVSGTSTGTTSTTLTDSGAAWSVDEHIGRWIVSCGVEGQILSNTATAVTVAATAWVPAPLTGPPSSEAYRIEDRSWYAVSLGRVLMEDYVAAAAAESVADGDTLDVQGMFVTVGESEASEEQRAERAYDNMKACIAYMRSQLVSQGATSLPSNKIPVVLNLVKEAAVWPYASTVNGHYQRIADEDLYVTTVATTDLDYGGVDGTDEYHFGATAQVELGRRDYEAWLELRKRETSATTADAIRYTLSDLRSLVRRRYERNTSGNDLTTPQLTQYINDALRDVYILFGDNCWFLRRMETVQITAAAHQTFTMPQWIRRIYRLELETRPGLQIDDWAQTGYTDQGRLQIVVPSTGAQSYVVHHIITPRDLSTDSDPCLVPQEYSELVVLYACKRAAEASANRDMADYYDREAARVAQVAKRDIVRFDRGRKSQMSTMRDQGFGWPGDGQYPLGGWS